MSMVSKWAGYSNASITTTHLTSPLAPYLKTKAQEVGSSNLSSNQAVRLTPKRSKPKLKNAAPPKRARTDGNHSISDAPSQNLLNKNFLSNASQVDTITADFSPIDATKYITSLYIENIAHKILLTPGVIPFPKEALESYPGMLQYLINKLKIINMGLEITLQLELQAAEAKRGSDSISPFSKEHPACFLQNEKNTHCDDSSSISSFSLEDVNDFLLDNE